MQFFRIFFNFLQYIIKIFNNFVNLQKMEERGELRQLRLQKMVTRQQSNRNTPHAIKRIERAAESGERQKRALAG